jgi:hypothetical protein
VITFGDAVTKVLQRLALVEGLDAQIYAEPRIQLALQHKFDMIFREYWLPEYTTYQEEHTLDATNGVVTDDLADKIKDWRDLRSVFYEHSYKQLPRASNDARHNDIAYPSIRPIPNKHKVFQVLPLNTQGKVWLTYRTKPDDFEQDSDEIYMDTQLLLLGTCWDVLEDDGTNPGASDKFRVLFQDSLAQFNRMQHNIPTDLISGTRSTVNRWW